MFGFLRLLICAIIAWIAFRFIKPISPKGRRIKIIGFIISVVLASTLLTLVPIENNVYSFDSPEASYRYFGNRGEVQLVVPGDECDFIVAKEGAYTTVYDIIPKTDDGWKLPANFDTDVASYNSGNVKLTVWLYKPTGEHFILVQTADRSIKSTVTDCYGSKFYSWKNGSEFEYYARVQDFNDQYLILIDGTEYKFNN